MKEEIPDIILESIRFGSHITVIYMLENIVDDKNIIDSKLLRTIIFIIISVIVYHLVLKKLFDGAITKMNNVKKELKTNDQNLASR